MSNETCLTQSQYIAINLTNTSLSLTTRHFTVNLQAMHCKNTLYGQLD